MGVWKSWIERPQSLWVRKALFQVHLWLGIGVGLYVLVISVSGSALVFRREIMRKYSRKAVVLTPSSHRMNAAEMKTAVEQFYPTYEIDSVREPDRHDRPDTVVLERDKKRIERLFDPYTGIDLGDPESNVDRAVQWLVNLHDNLLSGQTGRLVNGIGSLFVTLLALTGAIVWWPGIKNWRRSIRVDGSAQFARFNWDLHSAIGFWCSSFVLVWGVSGICFCFPGFLNHVVSGQILFWLTQLHFGRFGWLTQALWTMLGLVPRSFLLQAL